MPLSLPRAFEPKAIGSNGGLNRESEFVNDRERVHISKAVVVDLTLLRNKNFSLAVLLFSSLCRESALAAHSVALDFGSSNFFLAATILGSDCPVPASTTGWQFVQRAVAGALSNSSVARRALHPSGREAVVSYIKPAAVSCIKQHRAAPAANQAAPTHHYYTSVSRANLPPHTSGSLFPFEKS
ncbi:hypothetical protein ACLKA6_002868 [Drosophila palustris]